MSEPDTREAASSVLTLIHEPGATTYQHDGVVITRAQFDALVRACFAERS